MGGKVASTVSPAGVDIRVGGEGWIRKKGMARSPKRNIQKGKRFFFFCEKMFLPCLSLGMGLNYSGFRC